MFITPKLASLIHEWKLVESVKKLHWQTGDVDKIIECIDAMNEIEREIEFECKRIEKDYLIIHLN